MRAAGKRGYFTAWLSRAATRRSVHITHVNQPLGGEAGEQVEQIRFEPVGRDVVFGDQGVAQPGYPHGLLDQGPDARADGVDGVVDTGLELEDRDFAREVARHLSRSCDDD